MIPQSPYVPKQMNGPVINAYGAAQAAEASDADAIIEYLHGLSLDTAQETELENIGLLIGYPRPVVPEGMSGEDLFIFTELPLENPVPYGFSGVENRIGGKFSSIDYNDSSLKLDLGMYRRILRIMAKLKRYGVTIENAERIAKEFDNEFTLSWDEHQDIVITFANNIGYKNVWLMTNLFYRVCTSPQILIVSGGQ